MHFSCIWKAQVYPWSSRVSSAWVQHTISSFPVYFHLLPLTVASPEQYPQIRLLFSCRCKTRKKNYDKAGQGWSLCQELLVQSLPWAIHATILQCFWSIATLTALELGMKAILNYHVFSLWVSCNSFRYRSASSLPFRTESTNMFLPQVTFLPKSRWPAWTTMTGCVAVLILLLFLFWGWFLLQS